MRLIINTSSMVPIYEQIVESIRRMIASGELQGGEALPSVRTVANDLKNIRKQNRRDGIIKHENRLNQYKCHDIGDI